jgi:hypothetical protein
VPKDWLTAHLNHRLGFVLSFFTHPSTETASKKHYFHAAIVVVELAMRVFENRLLLTFVRAE